MKKRTIRNCKVTVSKKNEIKYDETFMSLVLRGLRDFYVSQHCTYPYGNDGQQGKRKYGAELSALSVCACVPSISYHCLRGDLCGSRSEYRRWNRRQLCHLDLYGLYGAAVLHPVQDRFNGKIYLLGTLRTEVVHYGLCACTQRPKRS